MNKFLPGDSFLVVYPACPFNLLYVQATNSTLQ